ncbi:hypothetical protein [Nocardioides coralli]|uniref:hypothetical protein n=1 Tax=Nocardioides coralli TaxID=2872154 RepID=UPI001CA3E682|nr:hypothetical protein [Nocardioides coralli]QZY27833.1 hypothetical protein K6T13_09960 [Nocardioides coralli]
MYGETSGMLRDALSELLRQHRIQQRIGGAGLHTVPETTTPDERKVIGEQIARYRYAVLVWSHQAMRAANPHINLEGSTGRTRGPAEELRYRLEATLVATEVNLPTLDELVTEQPFALVDTWRQAARACVLGEHDFANGVGYGRLSEAQCLTVIKDAADVVRAVVSLDRRYANIPGWQALKEPGRLGRAAETCATRAGYGEPDYTVDLRGWRPEPTLIEGPELPGITGVLQAQHNLLIHLGTFPTAHNLRVVLDSQRIVSREAARRLQTVDPTVAVRWERRAESYGRLVHETRDLGGMVGNGGPAAGQGSVAAVRMEKLGRDGLADPPQNRRLQRVSAGIDDRICNVIEHGVAQRLYFQRINVPGLGDHNGELVRVTRQTFVPITTPVQTELLAIVRSDLRPTPIQRKAPKGAAQSRLDFEAALHHRPPPRGASPDVPSI